MSRIGELAAEAMTTEWHDASFLRAFIDLDDDSDVFSREDAYFIEAARPDVVLAMDRVVEAARLWWAQTVEIREPLPPLGEALADLDKLTGDKS